ncbi:uncharacterized protein CDV56_108631 [Aspergillus thermomutatus]|uniref:Major facilitator superfamily (MFS) profile domain-containing protein n=1 Tax=Aspergillus thermomutatus TaxID=41047 RepID=A0A397HPE1_ASPTH|nr:uncharacterized protein CDV56_108631 [Aspergillus thermomutatus]RHZ63456.1 hypothetical protein CDV56_108631 [Aspergillus thermomutatus]
MANDKTITQKLVEESERQSYTNPPSSNEDLKPKRDTQVRVESYEESIDPHSNNPFADPEVAERYALIYDKAQYECRHVFDPSMTWTPEGRSWCAQTGLACLSMGGRTNPLGQMLMATDYNTGNTIFYVSFLLAELPSQLISKKLGPDRWIPMQITVWSVVATAQCALTGRGSFFATRALLGILEGGFIPDIVLWLSYFYTSRELPTRLGLFWTALSATTIITSFMAFGLLHMRGVLGWAGWRWLFLIEGLVTLLVGLASFFKMPASAVDTKKWFRPKGWFTDHEVRIVVNRVLRDDPSKGDMQNRQPITPRILWKTLRDHDLWPIYALGLTVYTPMVPVSSYITLTLKGLGFNTFVTNLLTIPYSVGHIIMLLGLTWLSERLNERSLVASLQSLWTLPCIIALRVWSGTMSDAWGTYSVVTVLLCYPYCHAILVGWTSKNANNVGTRSVSAVIYNSNLCMQLGNIVGNNIYRGDDKPQYRRGNSVLVGMNVLALVLFVFTKVYYVLRNRYRDRVWAGMTEEEQQDYIKNSKDTGSKRLDFRFAH